MAKSSSPGSAFHSSDDLFYSPLLIGSLWLYIAAVKTINDCAVTIIMTRVMVMVGVDDDVDDDDVNGN